MNITPLGPATFAIATREDQTNRAKERAWIREIGDGLNSDEDRPVPSLVDGNT